MRAVPLWNWRLEYEQPRRRAFIDVDPGFTQISIANGDKGLTEGVSRCERRFTFGYRYGADDSKIPSDGGAFKNHPSSAERKSKLTEHLKALSAKQDGFHVSYTPGSKEWKPVPLKGELAAVK